MRGPVANLKCLYLSNRRFGFLNGTINTETLYINAVLSVFIPAVRSTHTCQIRGNLGDVAGVVAFLDEPLVNGLVNLDCDPASADKTVFVTLKLSVSLIGRIKEDNYPLLVLGKHSWTLAENKVTVERGGSGPFTDRVRWSNRPEASADRAINAYVLFLLTLSCVRRALTIVPEGKVTVDIGSIAWTDLEWGHVDIRDFDSPCQIVKSSTEWQSPSYGLQGSLYALEDLRIVSIEPSARVLVWSVVAGAVLAPRYRAQGCILGFSTVIHSYRRVLAVLKPLYRHVLPSRCDNYSQVRFNPPEAQDSVITGSSKRPKLSRTSEMVGGKTVRRRKDGMRRGTSC
ncbi:hypothetical protein AG1IA_04841 [Rhizoctonia solani AG-1 IA]|uniref:Uncharacterized protein n=1 Tax=Thanatephorus cucumeris (strain AG1-IA) TaxID=983506 RepID=L8WWH1_THACA|nr:hypothetical protein AG1IA_04841 [Rhizoctonia solani AG-1 IA]